MARKDKLKFKSLYQTLRDIGETLSDMGGSSGALYGYLFISASTRIKEQCKDGKLNGLTVGVEDLTNHSGAKPGSIISCSYY